MNQLSKIVVGAVIVWIGVYLVVYLVFVLSGDDTSLAEEGGHGETFGGFKDKFIFNVLNKRDHTDNFIRVDENDIDKSLGSGMKYPHLTSLTATSVGIRKPELLSNPFLSSTCENTINAIIDADKVRDRSVAVIIPVRNEQRDVLVHTVKSIFYNSGTELKTVVVVDDRSDNAVKDWKEWKSDSDLEQLLQQKCYGGNVQLCLRIVRPKHRLGVSGAKAYGANIFASAQERGSQDSSVATLVFVDAHVVPSREWLATLAQSLDTHPKSIVYPTIDVIDRATGGMAPADNVLGAFDWTLEFRWENIQDSRAENRLALLPDGADRGPDSLLLSPASPGIMAMKTAYYKAIGGFDTTLTPWGQESVELSLRVWLCGGSVIRQPCARVAHRYDNLFDDTVASASNGVSVGSVDKNVMAVAEHWMPHEYRELVHQARFVGRVPYTIEVSHDARAPQALHSALDGDNNKCQDFLWYLEHIYPGLKEDAVALRALYKKHIRSDFLARSLQSLLEAHYSYDRHAQEPGAEQAQKHADAVEEREKQAAHDRLVPSPMYYPAKRPKNVMVVPKPVEIFKSEANGDPHEDHANKIRATLVCEDEPVRAGSLTCKQRVAQEGCNRDRYYMIFGCPRSCGMCDTDGMICVDFYERKCPNWAKEGRCTGEEADQMKHDCRMSCGHCHLTSLAIGANNAHHRNTTKHEGKEQQQQLVLPHPDEHGKNENPLADQTVEIPLPPRAKPKTGVADTLDVLLASQEVAPSVTVAQEEWKVNKASEIDSFMGQSSARICPLPPEGSHVKLLSRVHGPTKPGGEEESGSKSRIFCGIYTYDRNHATNVKATKETWAKRCDGFLAFSTKSDPSIPSVKVLHEGPEQYDNMWQKSRAIWKYVHKYLNNGYYDFFLLGGDDMFYLVENLRAYLNTQEIQERVNDPKTSGLFLGRRFFPPKQKVFNSGGAGYLLDRKALSILAANLDSPKCWPHQRGFWEDVNVANCLRTSTDERKEWGPYGQILPYDTRDSKQRERFHPFTPGQHLEYHPPKPGGKDWYQDYNPELKLGYECCSTESVSFHYVPADLMRKLYVQHYYCPTTREQHGFK